MPVTVFENGPCYKRKPWIPPPARTAKEDAAASQHEHSSRGTSASRREHPCSGESTAPSWRSSSPSGAQTVPRRMVHTEKLPGAAPGSIACTQRSSNATSTSTGEDVEHLKNQVVGLQGALEAEKLSKVVYQLEAECEKLAQELQQREEVLTAARRDLDVARGHIRALRVTLAVTAGQDEALSAKHKQDSEKHRANFVAKAAELRKTLANLGERQDVSTTLDFASGVIPRVWEQLTGVLSRMEQRLSSSSHEDLIAHLNAHLKETEERVSYLQRELDYHRVRGEQERARHERCLDALRESHRQQRHQRSALQGRLKSATQRAAECQRALEDTALVLNQREKELGQVRRQRDRLQAVVDGVVGERLQDTLDAVQRRLVELEPVARASSDRHRDSRADRGKVERSREGKDGLGDEAGCLDHRSMISRLQDLAEALGRSRDPGCRQLVACVDKLERDLWKLGSGDRRGVSLNQNSPANPVQWPDEDQRGLEAGIASKSGDHLRPPAGDVDREKQQLRGHIAELQGRLNRVEASNRNLTSYIATLRHSYAAVFKETPESSLGQDDNSLLVEDS